MTRILLVEDEESYRDPLTYQLEREGFDVVAAATGPEALTKFDEHGADLVLLDLMLPGLSGTEVCRRLRLVSDVPVIMLTAKDDEIDKVVGLELGADDYVTKPYSSRELLARVRAVLRRRESVVVGLGAPVPSDLQDDDELLVAGPVRLDVERLGVADVVRAPDAVDQLAAREHPARVAEQQLEQLELLERERHRLVVDRDRVCLLYTSPSPRDS